MLVYYFSCLNLNACALSYMINPFFKGFSYFYVLQILLHRLVDAHRLTRLRICDAISLSFLTIQVGVGKKKSFLPALVCRIKNFPFAVLKLSIRAITWAGGRLRDPDLGKARLSGFPMAKKIVCSELIDLLR